MVEFGIIKFFDSREGKNYGFAIVLDERGSRTKEEIFFHVGDSSLIDEGDDDTPVFTGSYRGSIGGRPRNMMLPAKGDKIVFERKPGKKGDKASPWGYESSWKAAQDNIDERRWEEENLDDVHDFDDWEYPDEDDSVSATEVYNRAYSHFGNHEMAREAATMYPGDFI